MQTFFVFFYAKSEKAARKMLVKLTPGWGWEWLEGVTDQSTAKPNEFNDGHNAEADAKAEKAADIREEIDPSWSQFINNLNKVQ